MDTKLKIGLIILIVICAVGGWFILTNQDNEFCTGNLENCVNKNITIEGEGGIPLQRMGPLYIPEGYLYIQELDTKYGQIALHSKEEINCEDSIKVYGLLEKVVIECTPETKGGCKDGVGYEGYHLFVYTGECLKK